MISTSEGRIYTIVLKDQENTFFLQLSKWFDLFLQIVAKLTDACGFGNNTRLNWNSNAGTFTVFVIKFDWSEIFCAQRDIKI